MQPETIEQVIARAVERAIPQAVERYLAARPAANTQSEPIRFTVPQLAKRLGCSERQAWRKLSLKEIHGYKLAGNTVVDLSEVERYERSCRGEEG